MASANKNIKVFLNNNSIFTLDELRKYFAFPEGSRKALDLIHEQKKYNRIGVIKSGLYFVVQPGNNPESVQVDPYLLSLKNVNNSIVAFHSAMELLGYSHSIFNITYSLSNRYRSSLKFRDQTIQYIMVSEILLKKSKEFFGTEKVERLGIKVTVTGKERTLVESLERPQYCGGFEEMYRSLEKMPYIDFDILLQYLDLREQKNLFSRVGYFLEQHRKDFNVEEKVLLQLEKNVPSQPLYWDRSRKSGIIKKRWNLIVPSDVDKMNWEEI